MIWVIIRKIMIAILTSFIIYNLLNGIINAVDYFFTKRNSCGKNLVKNINFTCISIFVFVLFLLF